ncbi:guanine nucleotide binding protein, alpha subunit [Mycena leptocephala]|nr:guanine nucleotide binding protein, alpha subunit [Mycena leptocephala]
MMRWFQGSRVNENSKALARNTEIEDQLRLDSLRAKNEINMLLLGAGGSDQSTLLRQMKLLHYDGYSARERNAYKQIIFSNIIEVMRAIFEAMPRLDLELAPANNARRAIILSLPAQIEAEVLPPDIADAIRGLWRDPGVKEAIRRSRRGEFQLSDDAVYYFNSIDRVAEAHYLPTDQDILRSRVKTTGITEVNFQIGELTYKVLDPSGQPSNGRKWLHCFESVKAILFCASLSDYDQFLDEDKSVAWVIAM